MNLKSVLLCIEILLACVVLASFGGRHWWVADILANMRIQLFIFAAVLFIAALILRRPRDASACLLIIAVVGVNLRSGFWPRPASIEHQNPSRRVSICVCNVFTGNRQFSQIADIVIQQDADIVGIIELSSELSDICNSALREHYPHQSLLPQEPGNFGIGILSRYPLKNVNVFTLNEEWIPSIEAIAETQAGPLRVVVTHTLPPIRQRNLLHRNTHLQMLARRINLQDPSAETPVVVVGDLNMTPWSPNFDDWLQKSGLMNASAGFGFQPTWFRGFNNPFFGLMLDHACCSSSLKCVDRSVSDDFGSDHRAVTFTFQPG